MNEHVTKLIADAETMTTWRRHMHRNPEIGFEETKTAAGIAADTFGRHRVETNGPAFMGSEDFAFFAQKRPGTYCVIGNGDTPMVHHPMYDFDDRNLPVGAAYWVAVVESYLRKPA